MSGVGLLTVTENPLYVSPEEREYKDLCVLKRTRTSSEGRERKDVILDQRRWTVNSDYSTSTKWRPRW